jgi:hypothetical protein
MVSPIGVRDATGDVITVTIVVAMHPVANVYVMVVVPPVIPVTIPVPAATLATPAALLVHAPPVDVLVRVILDAGQTTVAPPIADGEGLTVNVRVRKHPVANE